MPHFAIALFGRDRPGIVAGLTGILLELGCNLEDVTTSILRGQFATMLVCSAPAEVAHAELRSRLEAFAEGSGFMVAVWAVSEGHTNSVPTHALTVYGPDRNGIVHLVAEVLARHQANICDMTCRLRDEGDAVYVLSVEVEVPGAVETLDRDLASALDSAGLQHTMREIGSEVL